jgi:hypothetical protein
MAKAIALARIHVAPLPAMDLARTLLVSGSGLALIFAGPALPF